MAHWNSQVRGNIIAMQTAGLDPTTIVGEGNLMPTSTNPNGYVGIPEVFDPGEMNAPPMDTADIPSLTKKLSDPDGPGKAGTY